MESNQHSPNLHPTGVPSSELEMGETNDVFLMENDSSSFSCLFSEANLVSFNMPPTTDPITMDNSKANALAPLSFMQHESQNYAGSDTPWSSFSPAMLSHPTVTYGGPVANASTSFPTSGMSSQAHQVMFAVQNNLCTTNDPAMHSQHISQSQPEQLPRQQPSQPQIYEAYGSGVDSTNGGSQLNQPSQREAMPHQLLQGDSSQDPQQTKSEKLEPLTEQKSKNNSLKSKSDRANKDLYVMRLEYFVQQCEENYPDLASRLQQSLSAPEERVSKRIMSFKRKRNPTINDLIEALRTATALADQYDGEKGTSRMSKRQGKHERESRADSLDQLNDSQLSNDVQCPSRNSDGVVINAHLSQNHEDYRAAGAVSGLLDKINANSQIMVDLANFPGLDLQTESVQVGKYNFPKSLECIAKKIESEKGDVTADCNMPKSVKQPIIVLLCASIEEMENQKLEEVTEDKILKWSTTIKYALDLKFKVEFAMKHLKEVIVPDYIEVKGLEDEWKVLQEKSKAFKEDIERLNGKPVGMGLFA